MSVSKLNNYNYIVNQFWSGNPGLDMELDIIKWQKENKGKLISIGSVNSSHFQQNHEIELNMKYASLLGYKGEIPSQWVAGLKWRGLKGKTVGIHAGCYGGVWEKKQWPHFEELITQLKLNGFTIYLFGSKKEGLNILPDAVCLYDYTDLPLDQTCDFISICDYFIANDSGLMHIADAIGVPTIAIFGPTLPVKNRPVGEYSLTLQATEGAYDSCVPCLYTPLFQECKYQKCLENITAEFVFEQFEKHRSELNDCHKTRS